MNLENLNYSKWLNSLRTSDRVFVFVYCLMPSTNPVYLLSVFSKGISVKASLPGPGVGLKLVRPFSSC